MTSHRQTPSQPAPASQPAVRLSVTDQHGLRWVVDRLHVGTSQTGVVREVRRRLPTTPKPLRKAAYRYALQYHRENGDLYRAVVSGRL